MRPLDVRAFLDRYVRPAVTAVAAFYWGTRIAVFAVSGGLVLTALVLADELGHRWDRLSTGTQVAAYITATLLVAAVAQESYRAFRRWWNPEPDKRRVLIEGLEEALGDLRQIRQGADALWEDDELTIAGEWFDCWRQVVSDFLTGNGEGHKFPFIDTAPPRMAMFSSRNGRQFSDRKMHVLHHIDARIVRLAEYLGQQ